MGHIMTGSFMGRGNQYIQLVKVLYCKPPTTGRQLPAFLLEVKPGKCVTTVCTVASCKMKSAAKCKVCLQSVKEGVKL